MSELLSKEVETIITKCAAGSFPDLCGVLAIRAIARETVRSVLLLLTKEMCQQCADGVGELRKHPHIAGRWIHYYENDIAQGIKPSQRMCSAAPIHKMMRGE